MVLAVEMESYISIARMTFNVHSRSLEVAYEYIQLPIDSP